MLLFLPRHRLLLAEVIARTAFPKTVDTTSYVRHLRGAIGWEQYCYSH